MEQRKDDLTTLGNMGPITSKMKSSSQSPVFITVMWSLSIHKRLYDFSRRLLDNLINDISADIPKTGSLLDRELFRILKRDISFAPLACGHFQVFLCVVAWTLSSVFSIFCITSCSDCTCLQLRKTTSFLRQKVTSPLCLEKNMKEKSIKHL